MAVDLGDTELCEIVRSAPVGSCAARTAFAKTLRALVSGRGPTDSFKSSILAAG